MSDRIDEWVDRFLNFDFWTAYSDDYTVWARGREAQAKLQREVNEAGFTDEEKREIMARAGVKKDARYLAARARWSSVAEDPLWDEGDGPPLKRIMRGYLRIEE